MPSLNNNQFASAAMLAYQFIIENNLSAADAWNKAAEMEIQSMGTRIKGCPKETFIGLCESGILKKIPKKKISASRNYEFALYAIKEWQKDQLISNSKMWEKVSNHFGFAKNHNRQLDVVEGLWDFIKIVN
jgi:hypothetical protein